MHDNRFSNRSINQSRSFYLTKHDFRFVDVYLVDGYVCCLKESQSNKIFANSLSLANRVFVCLTTQNAMLILIIHSGFEVVDIQYPRSKNVCLCMKCSQNYFIHPSCFIDVSSTDPGLKPGEEGISLRKCSVYIFIYGIK